MLQFEVLSTVLFTAAAALSQLRSSLTGRASTGQYNADATVWQWQHNMTIEEMAVAKDCKSSD
jgi:hypothetical protein